MTIRYPSPLRPGDLVGVTSPSSGVAARLAPRLEAAIASLRARGYDVVVGDCMAATGPTSAPKAERAAELMRMLTDPAIRAVVPPWGGELAVDLLDLLDWDALAAAEPTWLVGFSDISTLLLPLTVRLAWATLHGGNLMDTPYEAAPGLVHWTDVAAATEPVTQTSPGRYRSTGWDDYAADPGVSSMTLDQPGRWTVRGGGTVDASGRLLGGCIETLSPIAGSPYADLPRFAREHADNRLIVYLEAAESDAYTIARALHGLRLAGWFDAAEAVLIGRTGAPDSPGLTQREAVLNALEGVRAPLVLDVECGHVQPFLPLVNGATARVVVNDDRQQVTQTRD